MTQNSSSSHKVCRICRSSSGSLNSLPCACHGSIGYAHDHCLAVWTKRKRSNVCEVCLTKYKLKPTGSRLFQMRWRSFFSRNCLGYVLKKMFVIALVLPLAYGNIKDMIMTPDLDLTLVLQSVLPTVLMLKGLFLYEVSKWISSCLKSLRFRVSDWWNCNLVDDSDDFSEGSDDEFSFEFL